MSPKDFQSELDRLRREIRRVERAPATGVAPQVKLARVTDITPTETEDVPADGFVCAIEFLVGEFDEEIGGRELTQTVRQETEFFAFSLGGGTPVVNDVVIVAKLAGLWWIIERPCPGQNEIQRLTVVGMPTGGTLSLAVTINDVTEPISLDYNSSAAAAETALEGHSEATSGDFSVTGGPLPNTPLDIEFQGNLANIPIELILPDWGSLTGGSGVYAWVQRVHEGRP